MTSVRVREPASPNPDEVRFVRACLEEGTTSNEEGAGDQMSALSERVGTLDFPDLSQRGQLHQWEAVPKKELSVVIR